MQTAPRFADAVRTSINRNKIGDAGMADFSRAIASGSLPMLNYLNLEYNEIGDDGMAVLSRAIASGGTRS